MTDRKDDLRAMSACIGDVSRKYCRSWAIALSVIGAALIAGPVRSQDRTVLEDYTTQMPGAGHEATLGPALFGDQTDSYSGATSFLVTDVDLPGNSDLPVKYQRSLEAFDSGLGNQHNSTSLSNMMTWSRYEVPYVGGVYSKNQWVAATGPHTSSFTQQRCSYVEGPPEIPDPKSDDNDYWAGNEYWHGNHLYMPGSGEQLMLIANPANAPTDGATYRWATKDHWHFSCLPSTANGWAGEGFLARAPDGKKYYFDHLVHWRQVSTLRKLNTLGDIITLTRSEWRILLTRVEDRYGNWVSYTYSGKDLTSITASDGRQITIAYVSPEGPVSSVSDGTRTWTYDYSSGFRVTFPDSTTWRSYLTGSVTRGKPTGCETPPYSGSVTLTIEHRSGAVGAFAFAPLRRGLSYAPYGGYLGVCEQRPRYYDNVALYSKTISGPDIPTATWSYAYGPPNGCYVSGPNACTAASPTTRTVEVTGPGVFTRYTFGNKYQDTEGALFRIETGSAAASILRDESITWETFPVSAYVPSVAGFLARIVRTAKTRTIAQEGATYSTVYSNWDNYFQPQTIAESGPNGGSRTTQITYHNNTSKWVLGQVATRTSPAGSSSTTFNALADVESSTQDGVATSYTYHPDGTTATVTYPRSLVHSFSDYKRGVPRTETQPEGISLSRVVSDAGFVTSMTNGEGRVTGFGRDSMGRITSVDVPLGNDLTLVYSGATKSVRTTTRGALVETVEHDALRRPTRIVLGGIATIYEYDAQGRKKFESNPGTISLGTAYQYDALDRLTRVTNPDSTYKAYTYGPANVTIRDERGKYTTYNYRAYGSPATNILMGIVAADSAANVTITRGPDDLVTDVTQAGQTRSLGYDSRKYLVSETNPETGATVFERDAAGNMTARTTGGTSTSFAYDGQNRLVAVTYPAGTPSVTQTYSKTHKMRTVSSSAASRVLSYDANDNLTSESLTIGGVQLVAQYGYTGNDQLSSVTYPVSGRVVSFAPDVLGRPTQASGYVSTVSYWPSGMLQQIEYANGLVTNYEQNNRLWPSAFRTRRAGTYYVSSDYLYDGLGNLTTITDAADAGRNRSLGYDDLNRLNVANGPWGSGAITYDGAGNIRSQGFGSYSLTYAYDSQNRLSGVSGSHNSTYSYDGRGNVTADGAATYQYDSAPNLRCVNCAAGNNIAYGYDGLNKRVTITKAGTTSYEFHAANGDLLVEYTPTQSNKLIEYIYIGGKRVAQRVSDSRPPTPVTLPSSTVVAKRNAGVTLTVNVGGASPTGTVTFLGAGGTVIGTAYVSNGRASIDVLGLALGSHTITAVYSGDAANSSNTVVLQINVVNLDWLPAVLDLLLADAEGETP